MEKLMMHVGPKKNRVFGGIGGGKAHRWKSAQLMWRRFRIQMRISLQLALASLLLSGCASTSLVP